MRYPAEGRERRSEPLRFAVPLIGRVSTLMQGSRSAGAFRLRQIMRPGYLCFRVAI